ncbi:hypothetical protein ACQP04_29340 [Pseudonocardia halophobica]|uniref:hypothetical protein n=1 Tax=Pseudonocardia halophobica TaxID=29401 RepID=UPI003D94C54C
MGVLACFPLAVAGCAGPSAEAPPSTFLSAVLNTHDPSATGYGFTVLDATPQELAAVGRPERALIWLGGYDDVSCSFVWSDDDVRAAFARYKLASDPRTVGYYLADEPNSDGRCPIASDQVRRRAELVRSLDPDRSHFTLVNVDNPDLFAAFRDAADVLATDPYPCTARHGCDWSLIPAFIARLRAARIPRYVAMLQAFSGEQWRWPTAPELQRMIDQWRSSDWCGAITFSWAYSGGRLADHPDLLAVLDRFNAELPQPARPCW